MTPTRRCGPDDLNGLRSLLEDGWVDTGTTVGTELVFERPDRPAPQSVVGLLTGGRSTRMGRDKATTPLAGISMARRVAGAAEVAGLETVILGDDDAGTGLEHLPDLDGAPSGPLGGLLTLLADRPGRHVILVATDQPFVRAATLLLLALQPEATAVVPIADAVPQVTCARYGAPVLSAWRTAPDAVWRLRSVLDEANVMRVEPARWQTWGEDGRSFDSLDRPEDIDNARRTYGV